MKLAAIPPAILADMVRKGCYTKGESLREGKDYLLVLAVHYGEVDDVGSLGDAFEAFRELLYCDDWVERNIQVLRLIEGKPNVQELSYENL